MPTKSRAKHKMGAGQKVLMAFLILVILVSVLAVAAVAYLTYISSQINHNELDKTDLGISSQSAGQIVDDANDTSITNIALFGVDQRNDQTQVHSDAIIIATVDKRHNKIKLSSLMRDCLVEVEGYGQKKLTEAYFYGGPQLAVKTINQNFGLNVSEYVTVNFEELANIIDAVGGIEVDITEAERQAANGSIKEQSRISGLPEDYIIEPGLQTLSGTQAVAFARIRKVSSDTFGHDDFGRTGRQRYVLMKLFEKAKSMSPLQYPGFVQQFLPTVETSLDMNEILSLGSIMLRDVTFEDVRFPLNEDLIGSGEIRINGISYVNLDLDKTGEHLRAFIFDDINPTVSSTEESDAA